MEITYEQTYQEPLAHFGAELVQMIKNRNYLGVCDRFGYAMAYGRPLADAIAFDIEHDLTIEGRSAIVDPSREARILVKYFKQPNDCMLFGLVECFLPLDQDDGELLVELIVTTKENKFYVGLEGVSYEHPKISSSAGAPGAT
ncbi:hypothetical protein [Rhodanobacter hydrolyticus]|uniref:Uncharacterized protein n=1 Tax=Rhodanobacter hydrolyticus TaxID=2250595 RepID=A0ABW8J9E1_9GAMM